MGVGGCVRVRVVTPQFEQLADTVHYRKGGSISIC